MTKVYLIASTTLLPGFHNFLDDLGHSNWFDGNQSPGDLLCETAGRLCYKSWAPGRKGDDKLNTNVTKVRYGNEKYLENILNSGHGSVLEHANLTFLLCDVSRVLTHELVRHRVGVAYSQESLRYCKLEALQIVEPTFPEEIPEIDVEDAQKEINYAVERIRDSITILNDLLLTEDSSFDFKKKVTSLIRRIAPIGIKTNIMFTANVRALRHIITERTSVQAEAEIRSVFQVVAALCEDTVPNCFQDMVCNIHGEYVCKNRKV